MSGKETNPLKEAARLIEAYAKTLSGESTVCPHCFRETYTNWDEHLEAGELQRMIVKLRKLSPASLPNPTEPAEPDHYHGPGAGPSSE